MRISDWSSDVCSSDLPFFLGKIPRREIIGRNLDVLRRDLTRLTGRLGVAGEEQPVAGARQQQAANAEKQHTLPLLNAFIHRKAGTFRNGGGSSRTARRPIFE